MKVVVTRGFRVGFARIALLALAGGFAFPISIHAQNNVRAGFGLVVGPNIVHANGNRYDQVLMTGPSVTVAADPGEIVRVSFVDIDDDITQVEFAGMGTVTIELEPGSYRSAARPAKYDQPEVNYVKGLPTVRVNNAGADTYVTVFSVGRANAANQAIFRAGAIYDGMADVKLLSVEGPQIGGVLAGNVRFSAESGTIGIDAPNTSVVRRVVIGEIDARGTASPRLRIGRNSALEQDGGVILVAGGQLQQSNGVPIDATSSDGVTWPRIDGVAGMRSTGETLPAAPLRGQFVSRAPATVSLNGVARPTRGYVPSSFDTLRQEIGFDAIDFGEGTSVSFSGGNNGTYAIGLDTYLEGERVIGQLTGGYSYSVSGSNQNQMTFTMTFGWIAIAVGGESFSGTLYNLASELGEPVPVSISATATYTSATSGTFSIRIAYTDGTQWTEAGSFDEVNGFQIGFL